MKITYFSHNPLEKILEFELSVKRIAIAVKVYAFQILPSINHWNQMVLIQQNPLYAINIE
jgi:hypothetical protein